MCRPSCASFIALFVLAMAFTGCSGGKLDTSKEEAWAKRFAAHMKEVNDVIATIKTEADLKKVEPKLTEMGKVMRKLQKEADGLKQGRSPADVQTVSDMMAPMLNAEQQRTSQIMRELKKANLDLFEKVRDALGKMGANKKR